MDRLTSSRAPFVANEDQTRWWEVCQRHRYVICAKPRKTGITTATILTDVVETAAADAEGHAFLCVIAIDTDDKAKRLAAQVRDFVTQLGVDARHNEHGVKFRNGSEIVCATAGGFMPGRGTTIHRLHVSELPFWRTPRETYGALRSACADDASIVIETTMDQDDKNFCRDFWRGWARDEDTGNSIPIAAEFHREFFTVEDHASYRSGAPITDDEWRRCQGEGFTDRRASAWWLKHALPNLCAGDETRLLHDYPQKEGHLFAGASGRVITVTPQIARVVDRITVHGVGGKLWTVEVYVRPEHTSPFIFVPVDTAWGKGPKASRSVVLAVDRTDERVLAALASNTIMYDDLAPVAAAVKHYYESGDAKVNRKAELLVEINGSGQATQRELTKMGVSFTSIDQTELGYGPDECVKAAKRAIEVLWPPAPSSCARHATITPNCAECGGIASFAMLPPDQRAAVLERAGKSRVAGPLELAEECDSLRRERNEYVGLKDCLMTYGWSLVRRRQLGIRDDSWKKDRQDPMRIHVDDRMKEERRLARERLPRFGRRV